MDEEDSSGDEDKKVWKDFSIFDKEQTPLKRPRGILSHADREYLYGLREYEHAQSESNRKQDIRERISSALWDYIILYRLLPQEERKKIFHNGQNEYILNNQLPAMIAFLYLGLEQDTNRFAECVKHGVLIGANAEQSGRSGGEAINVDVSIDIEYNPDLEKLQSKLKDNPDQLTPSEIGVLARDGELDSEDLEQLKESKTPGDRLSDLDMDELFFS